MPVIQHNAMVNEAVEILRDQLDELAYAIQDLRGRHADLDDQLVELEDDLSDLKVEEELEKPEAVVA